MSLVVTEATVLHAFDYLESSRIVRFATREAGVVSVIAKGARRSRRGQGNPLDLFTDGVVQLHVREGRDLHTLATFDPVRARPRLATDLARFGAAEAIAELVLRFGRDDEHPELYERLRDALDAIAASAPADARAAALGGAWRLVAELGFAPTTADCASCHVALADDADVVFHHRAGGALCARCAVMARGGRTLPAEARRVLRRLVEGEVPTLDEPAGRAHQRLLREFLHEHLTDGRPLRAMEMWERERWSAA